MLSIEGRSLIRTFLAGATQDAAICLESEEQDSVLISKEKGRKIEHFNSLVIL